MKPPSTSALPSFLSLQVRPELAVAIIRWLRPVSAAELQQGYHQLLQHAQTGYYWLVDLRQRGPASEDDTHWVLTQFIGCLARQTGQRVYLAFLVTAGQLNAEEQQSGSPMVQNEQAHVRLFGEEAPALHWLASRRQHHSA
ncbi:hypothetical protein [Hymenobacter sp. UYP22]|uniref:hypothetical protein n=1 Tax=Hymenobacter sp. UYP22 TaxID=3156348 RepID=UPI00339A696A